MTNIPPLIPINNNLLSPTGFKFKLRKLPVFEHFVQSVDFPDLSMIMSQGQYTPFVHIPISGGALSFDPITIEFKVDEYMQSYTSIFDWMNGIDSPEDLTAYAKLETQPPGLGIEADATFIVLDSSMAPSINFYFKDMFPTSLKLLGKFDTKNREINYIPAVVTFEYTSFTYEQIRFAS